MSNTTITAMNYRFTGHETFPCRYAWLPKAYRALEGNTKSFVDEDAAMVALGVGKNMVRAIRFWVQAMGIANVRADNELLPSDFGKLILARRGFDPFLEDRKTLWLLHWNLSTQVAEPLFAWDQMLNRWHNPEITRSAVLRVFQQASERIGRKLSPVTLEQHYDVFFHTYMPTRGKKGEVQEDNLDCPLTELEIMQKIGERKDSQSNKREEIFAFRRDDKVDISPQLFVYFIDDFWRTRCHHDLTLSFRDLSTAHGSPGQILKISEMELRQRLETIHTDSAGRFEYRESANLRQLVRIHQGEPYKLSYVYN